MADVFVSYSREDSSFVARLAGAIESNGKQVWIDTSDIADTDVFPLAIRSAIESSDAFLFVISPASTASSFCEQEVDHAISLNKRIVPVLWARVSDDELPAAIRERNWIPFTNETEFGPSLQRVLHALDSDLEHRRSHTRWLTKAIEWDKENRDRSLLLRGSELRSAETWPQSTTETSEPAATVLQREHLLASRQAAGRRSRAFVAASLLVTVVAVGSLVFALASRQQAIRERQRAVQLQMAASAQALALESQGDLIADPREALVLATRAVTDQATPETMLALREALDAWPLLESLPSVDPSCVSTEVGGTAWPSVAFRPRTDEIAENVCELVVFDANNGRVILRTRAHTLNIPADNGGGVVAYSPNGRFMAVIVANGLNSTVYIAEPNSGVGNYELPVPATVGNVTGLSWDPSGTTIGVTATGSSALVGVRGNDTIPLRGTSRDSSLAFASDGRFAVVGSDSDVTPVFDMKGSLVRQLPTGGSPGSPSIVAASPVGSLLAVAVNTDVGTGRIEIWSTRTWKEEFVLTTASGDEFSGLAFSPDGTRLAAAQDSGSAAVWSLRTRSQIDNLFGPGAAITSMVFSPTGSEVATAYADGEARIWRATGPELADLDVGGPIKSVALSGDALVVASLEDHKMGVSIWSRLSDQKVGHFLVPASSANDLVSLSPDGRYVADVSYAPCLGGRTCPSQPLRVFDVATGLQRGPPYLVGAEAMTWSEDDREIAVASLDLQLAVLASGRVWSVGVTGAEQCGLDGPPGFSANGSLVAWATRCGHVAVLR